MLDSLLVSSFVATVLTTLLLVASGRTAMARPRLRNVAVFTLAIGSIVAAALAAWAPAAVLASIAFGLRRSPSRWTATGATFLVSLLLLLGLYAATLVRATLVLTDGPLGAILGLTLLLLELGAMTLIGCAAFEMVDALCSDPRSTPDADLPNAPERWPVVCLQVPTYNEPPELVMETIRSLAAIDYPALRIQVIDNNTADERLWRPVEVACQGLGDNGVAIEFIHLPDWPGYKGGALNWGLAHLGPDVEIVGVVDADYLVDPDWLRQTVPHFSDPTVGSSRPRRTTAPGSRPGSTGPATSVSRTSSGWGWSAAPSGTRSSSPARWASSGDRRSMPSAAGMSRSSRRTPRSACACSPAAIARCTWIAHSGGESCP